MSSSYRAEFENPYMDELKATAKKIAGRGRGILASDESNATTGKRLDTVGVENTEDNRRKWRELLYTAPGLGQYISGAIMFEETLYQSTAAGKPFVDVLREQNIIPGIKVGEGGMERRMACRMGPARYYEWKWSQWTTDTTQKVTRPTNQLNLCNQVDTGLQMIAGTDGETATQGLDGLGDRCKKYYQQGARFGQSVSQEGMDIAREAVDESCVQT